MRLEDASSGRKTLIIAKKYLHSNRTLSHTHRCMMNEFLDSKINHDKEFQVEETRGREKKVQVLFLKEYYSLGSGLPPLLSRHGTGKELC